MGPFREIVIFAVRNFANELGLDGENFIADVAGSRRPQVFITRAACLSASTRPACL